MNSPGRRAPISATNIFSNTAWNCVLARKSFVFLKANQITFAIIIVEAVALASDTRLFGTAVLFEWTHQGDLIALLAHADRTPVRHGHVGTLAPWHRILTHDTLILPEANQSIGALRIAPTVTFTALTRVCRAAIRTQGSNQWNVLQDGRYRRLR
jgi:hypothetical protein